MTEFNRDKKSKLKEMQQKIASLKADIAKDSAKIKNMQRDVQTLQMEIGKKVFERLQIESFGNSPA